MHLTLNGEPAVVSERIDPFIGRPIVIVSLVSNTAATWSLASAARIVASGGSLHA
jgi:hypothetical protein